MKKEIPTKKHLEKLAEYNLQTIPPEKWISVRYQPGEAITREGVEIENLALVVSGMAKVYRTAPNGRNLILCYYLSDGVIGEIELLTRRKLATSTVTAISEFECIAIDSEICAAELKTNIPFSNKLGTTLAEKLER
ncbi:MAG TPA: cyclic nucleotide-binding domain-containing protein, partial [Flexilinea sp.]|nr:cyclic nucleotide-binding domain-containing protein [Flexilinea sp.]